MAVFLAGLLRPASWRQAGGHVQAMAIGGLLAWAFTIQSGRYLVALVPLIALAAIYAQEAMKFTQQQTIVLVLVVNVTAAAGAFGFGYLQDAIGHVRAMALILAGWIVMIRLCAMLATTETNPSEQISRKRVIEATLVRTPFATANEA